MQPRQVRDLGRLRHNGAYAQRGRRRCLAILLSARIVRQSFLPPTLRPSNTRAIMTKTWLITGCSTGFGRLLAQAALDRGDQVVATARDPATLADIAKGLSQDGGNDGARCDEARSRR